MIRSSLNLAKNSKVDGVTKKSSIVDSMSYGLDVFSDNYKTKKDEKSDNKPGEMMITDKALRKFYEHLDSINRNEVSPFQL